MLVLPAAVQQRVSTLSRIPHQSRHPAAAPIMRYGRAQPATSTGTTPGTTTPRTAAGPMSAEALPGVASVSAPGLVLRVHGWGHRTVGSGAGRAAAAAATRLPLGRPPPLNVLQRQALLVANSTGVAQCAGALWPAAPLGRLVGAAVAAGDAASWLLAAGGGLGSSQGTCKQGDVALFRQQIRRLPF
jgi:hypothetical protein